MNYTVIFKSNHNTDSFTKPKNKKWMIDLATFVFCLKFSDANKMLKWYCQLPTDGCTAKAHHWILLHFGSTIRRKYGPDTICKSHALQMYFTLLKYRTHKPSNSIYRALLSSPGIGFLLQKSNVAIRVTTISVFFSLGCSELLLKISNDFNTVFL